MRTHILILACVLAGLGGCRTYRERPLVPAELLERVEASRNLEGAEPEGAEAEAAAPSLPQAARWLHARSPALREARARFAQAQALADAGIPLPNPTLALGPLYGTNLGPGASNRFVPFVEFGFTLPLSGARGRQEDVDEALAAAAQVRLVVLHRQEYLALRSHLVEWSLARERERIQRELQTSATEGAALMRRLVDAGAASTLDAGVVELDVARSELAVIEARDAVAGVKAELARLTGVHPRHFRQPSPAAELPANAELPELEAGKRILVANHPELVRLRADYEVAERRLRAEIARQYPDLSIGTSFEGDPGEEKRVWGLAIGITLPIFDRNQRGIADAEHERERVQAAYEATLSRALAELEGSYAHHSAAVAKRRLVQEQILPRSAANLAAARRAIVAGVIDAFEFLEVERRFRATRAEALGSEAELWRTLGAIEQLLGTPIGLLPGEAEDGRPFVPESIAAPRSRGEKEGEKR